MKMTDLINEIEDLWKIYSEKIKSDMNKESNSGRDKEGIPLIRDFISHRNIDNKTRSRLRAYLIKREKEEDNIADKIKQKLEIKKAALDRIRSYDEVEYIRGLCPVTIEDWFEAFAKGEFYCMLSHAIDGKL